jgi:pimeloyl-ACP methyl ester carboxylesterase
MATFVLVPGAGGVAWYWHRVVRLLEEAMHEAIAVDLPGDDAEAGLSVYAGRVLEAIGTREVILVAQSLGGFTAPLVPSGRSSPAM